MKKAKFALVAIATVATLGGALAFTANKVNHKIYFIPEGSVCTTLTSYTLTPNGNPVTLQPGDQGYFSASDCSSTAEPAYFDGN